MDPQPFNSQDKTQQESLPPAMEAESTQPVAPVVTTAKKSHKRALIMAAIGLLLIAGALIAYMLYSQSDDTNSNTNTTGGTTESNTATTPLDEATDVYSDGATAETSLTESENSNEDASDASSAAGNVGDGVNENNL